MSFLGEVLGRLRSLWSLVRDRSDDRELDEEIRFHIDSEAERLRCSGMSAKEARRVAYVRFGGVERTKERTREERGILWMETLWTDLRLAHRALLRTPGQSLAAVLTLGIGIGAATAQFGTLYSAFYRALPFDDADRFVWVEQFNPAGQERPVPVHDFTEWRDGSRTLRDLGAVWAGRVGLRTSIETWQLRAAHLSWNSFDIVGAGPLLGRSFAPYDDTPDAPLVAIVSQRVWEERFDADPATIGRQVDVSGEPATIVGVMPEGFHFPTAEDVWLPLRLDPARLPRGEGPGLTVFGHLEDGVSLEAARADMRRLAAASAAAHPETNELIDASVDRIIEQIGPEALVINWMLMLAAVAVLVIACVNVANLLLARAMVRMREIALRSALGARRRQVALHVLAESLTLAIYGALLGAALGWAGVSAIAYMMSSVEAPYWLKFRVDVPVLVFTALAAAAAGIIAGLAPALRATGSDITALLKDGSRGSTGLRIGRLSRALVGVEVAFSVAVLVAAGLMSKSVLELARYDVPFSTDEVVVADVDLLVAEEGARARRSALLEEALDRLPESPAVDVAALVSGPPGLSAALREVRVDGRSYPSAQSVPRARAMAVSVDFFELLGVDVVAGRAFATLDAEDALRVAVVNESFTRLHLQEADPIGRRVRVGGDQDGEWRTIVGVVPDLLMQGLANVGFSDGAGLYVPTSQSDGGAATLLLRTRGTPGAVRDEVQATLRSIDPDLAVLEIAGLRDRMHSTTWYIRATAWILVAFGVIALFLACVGLSGVVAFESERRTQEIGVRLALGARGRDVVGLVVGQGVRQIVLGALVGLLMAVGLARGLTVVLFETDPTDVPLYLGAVITVLLVGALASLAPAVRASRTDPVRSLQAG